MSPEEHIPLSERIADVYKRLAPVASALNKASDELGKTIHALDSSLSMLNLGITSWVHIHHWEDVSGAYGSEDIGYARVDRKWGIALRTVRGHEAAEEDHTESWLFNDAPRALRMQAVEKLPDLFEKLIEEAQTATKKIQDETELAKNLSVAIYQAGLELTEKRKAEREAAKRHAERVRSR